MGLNTVRDRAELKPRREPYWQQLSSGQAIGYRPSKVGTGGTWIAKLYDPETRQRRLTTLGDFGELSPSERYSAAVAEARKWFDHLSGGGRTEATTVAEACQRYSKNRPEAEARFKRYIYPDPIAHAVLRKLTEKQVRDWRSRLEATPARVSRSKGKAQITRARSAATINRDMVPFRAALNLALDHAEVQNSLPWRKALEPLEAKGRRNLYLDKDQRRTLLANVAEAAKPFVQGLCLLPLRPGALAALRVGDFDRRKCELTIERDKAGEGRRILLPDDTAAVFHSQCSGKLPAAPLFSRPDARPWDKDAWKGPIKDAARAANLPPGTTAYTLRHSTITDLVQGGLDLLTIAQVSGTSVAIIEKHYGHLQRKHAAVALAGLAL